MESGQGQMGHLGWRANETAAVLADFALLDWAGDRGWPLSGLELPLYSLSKTLVCAP